MTNEKPPTVIKKYANRRLYHTGTSTYVTLEDLAAMVKAGEDFVVYDAKSSEDITRSVLTQIIFEQEGKEGQNLLPITVLRQLIRFYGDSIQALVPSYLELSMDNLAREQAKLREHMTKAFGPGALGAMQDQARANMTFFSEAMRMFSPFTPGQPPGGAPPAGSPKPETERSESELDALKAQMADMQAKLEALSKR